MPEINAYASVDEIAEGYRSGYFTPVDVCHAALQRLDDLEPHLNAFIDDMREDTLLQARQITDELKSGRDKGPLHGIPVAIKDIIDVKGRSTTYGSKALAGGPAKEDAACVAKLREAGAIIFGKTNLLEFAYGIPHPDYGQTNNPYATDRTSGGSSGGSAAAVAAGIVPLALGTDTGGSVRAPASYCGIPGLKPSFGTLSLDGVYPLSKTLDHLGIFARSARDTALAFSALSDTPPPADLAPYKKLNAGLDFSLLEHKALSPEMTKCVCAAISAIEKAGTRLHSISLPTPNDLSRALLDILLPEANLIHAKTYLQNPKGYSLGTAAQIEEGAKVSAIRYFEAKAEQQHWRNQLGHIFNSLDFIIAPTVPFVAPASDPALTSDEDDDEIVYLCHANLTGAPAISLPCGQVDGLPVGLQITAKVGEDQKLLRIARFIEKALLDANITTSKPNM